MLLEKPRYTGLSSSIVSAGITYTYDANGSQLTGDGATYTYNARGQQASCSKDGVTASYTYLPTGLRKSKTVGGTTTTFVWDGQNMVYEYTDGASAFFSLPSNAAAVLSHFCLIDG